MEQLIDVIQTNLATWSLWIGLGTVLVFAIGRFNETRRDLEGLDPPICVRNFTTRFRYNFAALTYAGLYSIFFMLLICMGSVPSLQEFLKDVIGSVPGMDEAAVGTPQWAALAITAALPTFPPIARIDQRLRESLRNFASIPEKAQSIADEIIAEVQAGDGEPAWGKDVYDKVHALIGELRGLKRLRAAEAYRTFFANNDAMLEQIQQKAANLESADEPSAAHAGYYSAEWARVTKQLARLIVCALLTVEVDEYSVRRTLRDDFGLDGIPVGDWRFRSSQILFSVLIVIVVTGIASVATTYIELMRVPGAEISMALIFKLTARFLVAGVLWGPIFLVPLLFCAGMQMYLIDLQRFGERLEADTRVLFFLMTAMGALVFAMLSMVLLGVALSVTVDRMPNLAHILPWAVPPAMFAITFSLMSRRHLFHSGLANAVVDFVVHGLVASLSGLFSAHLSVAFGLQTQLFQIPLQLVPDVAAVTSGLIGGTLGAVLCLISRMIHQGHCVHAAASDAASREQPERPRAVAVGLTPAETVPIPARPVPAAAPAPQGA